MIFTIYMSPYKNCMNLNVVRLCRNMKDADYYGLMCGMIYVR